MNIFLAISVLMIGLYVYLGNEFINLWRVLFEEHDDLLREAQIEIKYKVDRHIVASIWGMETNYGRIRGDVPVLSALATLATKGVDDQCLKNNF